MDPFVKRLIQKGSPFELMDAVIDGIPCKIFPRGPKTVGDVFLKAAAFKDKEFIVHGDERLSFETVMTRAKKLATTLNSEYGVTNGGRVALLMDNCPDWVIAFIGIVLSGTTVVVIHADAGKQAVHKALSKTGCSLIICNENNINKIESDDNTYKIILLSKDTDIASENKKGKKKWKQDISFCDLSNSISKGIPNFNQKNIEALPDDEALISFTSGTTGEPKGVVLTHRNMTTGLMNMMLGGFMMNYRTPKRKVGKQVKTANAQPSSLLLSPFSHIGGFSQIMLMAYLGGKIVLMKQWNAVSAANLIEKEQVKSISGAIPKMIRELIRGEQTRNKIQALANLNIHGSSIPKSFLREVGDVLPSLNVGTGYGMTETCGGISTLSGSELLYNPKWIGPVLPSVDIKIIDETGKQQEVKGVGEICVRGAMVMKEYCADQEKTRETFIKGWLKTGDLGYQDTDEKIYITDRVKDLMICGDQQFSATEIEQTVTTHNMVDEAVAFGVPSTERCEKIVVVILKNRSLKSNKINIEQVLSFIEKDFTDNLKLIPVDSFPRTSSGKVNRSKLRQQILSILSRLSIEAS